MGHASDIGTGHDASSGVTKPAQVIVRDVLSGHFFEFDAADFNLLSYLSALPVGIELEKQSSRHELVVFEQQVHGRSVSARTFSKMLGHFGRTLDRGPSHVLR